PSVEPWLEEVRELPGSSWLWEAGLDLLVLDHDERGQRSDLELRHQVGLCGGVYAVDAEGGVVASVLQHLGEKSVDASRPSGAGVEEEEQRRPRRRSDRSAGAYAVAAFTRLACSFWERTSFACSWPFLTSSTPAVERADS